MKAEAEAEVEVEVGAVVAEVEAEEGEVEAVLGCMATTPTKSQDNKQKEMSQNGCVSFYFLLSEGALAGFY